VAQAKWEDVSKYIQAVFEMNGRVDRRAAYDMALNDGADDDVTDAIDAIGSRIINTPDEVKAFLISEGWVVE